MLFWFFDILIFTGNFSRTEAPHFAPNPALYYVTLRETGRLGDWVRGRGGDEVSSGQT